MKQQSKRELVVGLFFFGGMLFLGAYTIMLSGLYKGPQKTYEASFPLIYGLKKGDQVRVEGLDKGEVTELRLVENAGKDDLRKVRAKLRVAKDVEIFKEGSEVKVTPFSPLGGRIVEIKRGYDGPRGKFYSEEEAKEANRQPDLIPGTAEGELLQTLNTLVEENKPGIATIVSNLAIVSNKLTQTDNVLGALINDAGTAQSLKDMSAELAETALSLNRILKRVERGEGVVGELVAKQSALHDNVSSAAASARGALEQANVILTNANEGKSALGVLVSSDEQVSGEAKAIVRDIALMTSDVAAGAGSLGKFVRDERFYNGAAATAENLGKITEGITKNQSAAGVLLNDPETGARVKSTLAHLDAISKSVNDGDGALGLVIKDRDFRDRVARIFTEVERLTVEFRDSVEDLREQAPINAFLGAVFAAF